MKLKVHFLGIILVLITFIYITGCDSSNNQNNNENKDTVNTTTDNTNEVKTFYLIPSPEDLFVFTKSGKLTYSAKLLNPTENTDKYVDTKAREINFGIYSADLAYSAAFSKYQESIKYLNVVRSLSDEIGISAVFDQTLVNRIENIIENKDSLIRVSSDTYLDIVSYLEKTGRTKTLALIAAGGWLESLYIVTNLVDKYSEKDPTIQQIADQKIIFSNMMLYLEQNQADESVKSIMADFNEIKTVFDKLETEKVEPANNKGNENKIVVGGGSKIKITKDQFNELKQAITKVRNKITGNNVL